MNIKSLYPETQYKLAIACYPVLTQMYASAGFYGPVSIKVEKPSETKVQDLQRGNILSQA